MTGDGYSFLFYPKLFSLAKYFWIISILIQITSFIYNVFCEHKKSAYRWFSQMLN